MRHGHYPVAIMQLPARVDAQGELLLLHDLDLRMDANRPRVVLDCSRLLQFDKPVVHLLLCCLEEAMKRNGDVKLAELPDDVCAIFTWFGLDGLFEVYATVSGAVDSFLQSPQDRRSQNNLLTGSQNTTIN